MRNRKKKEQEHTFIPNHKPQTTDRKDRDHRHKADHDDQRIRTTDYNEIQTHHRPYSRPKTSNTTVQEAQTINHKISEIM